MTAAPRYGACRAPRLRDNPQAQAHMRSMIAMDRVAGPEEIGDVMAFLASDDSRWITGQRIEASGGQSL